MALHVVGQCRRRLGMRWWGGTGATASRWFGGWQATKGRCPLRKTVDETAEGIRMQGEGSTGKTRVGFAAAAAANRVHTRGWGQGGLQGCDHRPQLSGLDRRQACPHQDSCWALLGSTVVAATGSNAKTSQHKPASHEAGFKHRAGEHWVPRSPHAPPLLRVGDGTTIWAGARRAVLLTCTRSTRRRR